MNDDEFDEMVREQHRLFTADISRIVERRPVPVHVSRRHRVTGVLSVLLGGPQPAWWVGGARTGAALVALGLAVVAFAVLPVQPSRLSARPEVDAPSPSVIHPGGSGCPCAVAPGPAKFGFPVLFLPDSAELTPEARELIIASVHRIGPGDRVLVVGHTARIGEAESARSFSVRRARAVADLLVSLGVAEDRLTVRGAGFDQSPPGQNAIAPSRRVDVDVVAPD
ncbi:OmpA family protein [Amycolatopsis sp. NPDC051102]|uniref:OmpA family protein n=1 Tax=Amycolatopsis sp. NPDC051102 TaxID=3155163 RepID=UPI00342AB94A